MIHGRRLFRSSGGLNLAGPVLPSSGDNSD